MHHDIKIDTAYLDAVIDGSKTFEIRCNDRDYKDDDTLIMKETQFPWRKVSASICYVTNYRQQHGYVVFGIKDVKELK